MSVLDMFRKKPLSLLDAQDLERLINEAADEYARKLGVANEANRESSMRPRSDSKAGGESVAKSTRTLPRSPTGWGENDVDDQEKKDLLNPQLESLNESLAELNANINNETNAIRDLKDRGSEGYG